MKQLWNSFKIAFSMYSKVPMPNSEWTKENMRYVMCFFPWVGIVIGLLMQLWLYCQNHFQLIDKVGMNFAAILLLLIPVIITGGIHLDGFLDTSDAMSSYQERERRLEILKDPRAGAFAIISGIVYFIIYFAIYGVLVRQGVTEAASLVQASQISCQAWGILSLSFVLSRSLSGLSVVSFQMAKNTGLAAAFSDGAQKKTVKITMIVYILVVSALMVWINVSIGVFCVGSAILVFLYYRHMAYKNFGGITGDLAGWFLQICEIVMAFAVMIAVLVLGGGI